jgi:hypothetical protein
MSIGSAGRSRQVQADLREITPDISKLVNLRFLHVSWNPAIEYLPDSISCLQNLESLHLEDTSVTEVPVGLATLENLESLTFMWWKDVRFPPSLQVRTSDRVSR